MPGPFDAKSIFDWNSHILNAEKELEATRRKKELEIKEATGMPLPERAIITKKGQPAVFDANLHLATMFRQRENAARLEAERKDRIAQIRAASGDESEAGPPITAQLTEAKIEKRLFDDVAAAYNSGMKVDINNRTIWNAVERDKAKYVKALTYYRDHGVPLNVLPVADFKPDEISDFDRRYLHGVHKSLFPNRQEVVDYDTINNLNGDNTPEAVRRTVEAGDVVRGSIGQAYQFVTGNKPSPDTGVYFVKMRNGKQNLVFNENYAKSLAKRENGTIYTVPITSLDTDKVPITKNRDTYTVQFSGDTDVATLPGAQRLVDFRQQKPVPPPREVVRPVGPRPVLGNDAAAERVEQESMWKRCYRIAEDTLKKQPQAQPAESDSGIEIREELRKRGIVYSDSEWKAMWQSMKIPRNPKTEVSLAINSGEPAQGNFGDKLWQMVEETPILGPIAGSLSRIGSWGSVVLDKIVDKPLIEPLSEAVGLGGGGVIPDVATELAQPSYDAIAGAADNVWGAVTGQEDFSLNKLSAGVREATGFIMDALVVAPAFAPARVGIAAVAGKIAENRLRGMASEAVYSDIILPTIRERAQGALGYAYIQAIDLVCGEATKAATGGKYEYKPIEVGMKLSEIAMDQILEKTTNMDPETRANFSSAASMPVFFKAMHIPAMVNKMYANRAIIKNYADFENLLKDNDSLEDMAKDAYKKDFSEGDTRYFDRTTNAIMGLRWYYANKAIENSRREIDPKTGDVKLEPSRMPWRAKLYEKYSQKSEDLYQAAQEFSAQYFIERKNIFEAIESNKRIAAEQAPEVFKAGHVPDFNEWLKAKPEDADKRETPANRLEYAKQAAEQIINSYDEINEGKLTVDQKVFDDILENSDLSEDLISPVQLAEAMAKLKESTKLEEDHEALAKRDMAEEEAKLTENAEKLVSGEAVTGEVKPEDILPPKDDIIGRMNRNEGIPETVERVEAETVESVEVPPEVMDGRVSPEVALAHVREVSEPYRRRVSYRTDPETGDVIGTDRSGHEFNVKVVKDMGYGNYASYDPNSDTITLSLSADKKFFDYNHELIHMWRKHDQITESEWGLLLEKADREFARADVEEALRERNGGVEIPKELVDQELVAKASQEWLRLPEISDIPNTLWQKFKAFIRDIGIASGLLKQTDRDLVRRIIGKGMAFERAPGVRERSDTGVVQVFNSFNMHPRVRAAQVEECKKLGMTQDEIDKFFSETDFAHDSLLRAAKGLGLEGVFPKNESSELAKPMKGEKRFGGVVQGAIRGNRDYFFSEDISATCPKRIAFAKYLDTITTALKSRNIKSGPLTADEREVVAASLIKAGYDRFCHFCYVETRRANKMKAADKFTRELFGEKQTPETLENPNWDEFKKSDWYIELKKKMAGSSMKFEDVDWKAFDDKAYILKELNTEGSKIKENADFYKVMDANTTLNATATMGAEEYIGQFMLMPDNLKRYLNATAGVRAFSISDMNIEHIVDKMDAFADKALIGVAGHSYVKVEWYPDLVAKTNEKVSMSLIGFKGEDGEYHEMVGESYPWEKAFEDRKKYEHVGTEIVGINDEMIRWAMQNDNIDYIIPNHQSGMEPRMFRMLVERFGAQNYEGEQLDKLRKWERDKSVKMTAEEQRIARKKWNAEMASKWDAWKQKTASELNIEKEQVHSIKVGFIGATKGMTNIDIVAKSLKAAWEAGIKLRFERFLFKTTEAHERFQRTGEFDVNDLEAGGAKVLKDYARTDTPLKPIKNEYNRDVIRRKVKEWEEGKDRPSGAVADPEITSQIADVIEKYRAAKEKDPTLIDSAFEWAQKVARARSLKQDLPQGAFESSGSRGLRRRPGIAGSNLEVEFNDLRKIPTAEEIENVAGQIGLELGEARRRIKFRENTYNDPTRLTPEAVFQLNQGTEELQTQWIIDNNAAVYAKDKGQYIDGLFRKTPAKPKGEVHLSADVNIGQRIAYVSIPGGKRGRQAAENFMEAFSKAVSGAGMDMSDFVVKYGEFKGAGKQVVAYIKDNDHLAYVALRELMKVRGKRDVAELGPVLPHNALLQLLDKVQNVWSESEATKDTVVSYDGNNSMNPAKRDRIMADLRAIHSAGAKAEKVKLRDYAPYKRDLSIALEAEGWMTYPEMIGELLTLSREMRGMPDRAWVSPPDIELFGDLAAAYFTDRRSARAYAPRATMALEAQINANPELSAKIDAVMASINKGMTIENSLADMIRGMDRKESEQIAKKQADAEKTNWLLDAANYRKNNNPYAGKSRDVLLKARRAFDHRHAYLRNQVKQIMGIAIEDADRKSDWTSEAKVEFRKELGAWGEMTINDLERIYHTHDTGFLYYEAFNQGVWKLVKDIPDISVMHSDGTKQSYGGLRLLGLYVGLNRIASGSRSKLGNPLMFTPNGAKEALGLIKERLGEEASKKLDETWGNWRLARERFIFPLVEESGLYKPALIRAMKNELWYAPFSTRVDPRPTATAFKQKGTYSYINNPAMLLAMNDLKVIEASILNKAKWDFVQGIKKYLPTEFNRMVVDFPAWMETAPYQAGFKEMSHFEEGVKKRYLVPEIIEETINNKTSGHAAKSWDILLKANKPIRALQYAMSLQWVIQNVWKDTMSTLMKNKEIGMHPARFTKLWGQSLQSVMKFVYGGVMDDPDLVRAIQNGAIAARTSRSKIEEPALSHHMEKFMASFGQHFEANSKRSVGEKTKHILGLGFVLDAIAKKTGKDATKYGETVFDILMNIGDISDMTTKLAGYKALKAAGFREGPDLFRRVRNHVGTPDYLASGTKQHLTNNVFMYSTIRRNGLKSAYEQYKTNKACFVTYGIMQSMPTLLVTAALYGLFGDDIKKTARSIWGDVPEFQLKRRGAIASLTGLGLPDWYAGTSTSHESEAIQTITFDLVKFLGNAFTSKDLSFGESVDTFVGDLWDDVYAQQPYHLGGISDALYTMVSFAGFQANLRDFRGKQVVSERNEKNFELGLRTGAYKDLFQYGIDSVGLGRWMSPLQAIVPQFSLRDKTMPLGESIVKHPMNPLGGFFFDSNNRGAQEYARERAKLVEAAAAGKTMDKTNIMKAHIKENGMTFNPASVAELHKELVGKEIIKPTYRLGQFTHDYKIQMAKLDPNEMIGSIANIPSPDARQAFYDAYMEDSANNEDEKAAFAKGCAKYELLPGKRKGRVKAAHFYKGRRYTP